jgi:hypothetical protein
VIPLYAATEPMVSARVRLELVRITGPWSIGIVIGKMRSKALSDRPLEKQYRQNTSNQRITSAAVLKAVISTSRPLSSRCGPLMVPGPRTVEQPYPAITSEWTKIRFT